MSVNHGEASVPEHTVHVCAGMHMEMRLYPATHTYRCGCFLRDCEREERQEASHDLNLGEVQVNFLLAEIFTRPHWSGFAF